VLAEGNTLPGSGWKSGQQAQNVGSASAKVVMTAYEQNGTSHDCGEKTVAAGASATFLTDADCSTVSAGFIGSAVLSADQAIAAIVNVNNRGTGAAAGQYQGTDGADVADTISFPLVKNNHSGRTTTFYVQNASTSPNNIEATFNVNGTYSKTYNNVPANAMVIINPSDAGVPAGQGQVGSLEVKGTQPLAGSSLEHQTTAAVGQNLQASKAFVAADGATDVYCPLYRNAHTKKNQTTGAQVQNVTNSAVTVKFTVNAGGNTYGPYERTIDPGKSETFYAPELTNPTIPAGTVGSATIESTGNVVAVVNDAGTDNGVQRKTTYACFGGGGTTVNVPLAKEFAGGNTTGIQVQNVGNADTKVTLEYKATTGPSIKIQSTAMVAPGQSVTAYGVSSASPEWQVLSSSGSMAGTVNGVVITADEPVVAIANESSAAPNPSGQDTKNYEGFNQ